MVDAQLIARPAIPTASIKAMMNRLIRVCMFVSFLDLFVFTDRNLLAAEATRPTFVSVHLHLLSPAHLFEVREARDDSVNHPSRQATDSHFVVCSGQLVVIWMSPTLSPVLA